MEVETSKSSQATNGADAKDKEQKEGESQNKNETKEGSKGHSIRKYFNNQFPCNNKDLFDSEKEELTKNFEEQINKLYASRDINQLITTMGKKRSKLLLLYGISGSVKQRLSEMMLHLTIEEQYMKLDSILFTSPFHTTSTLNWRPLWNYVQNIMFTNNKANTNMHEVTLPETISFLQVIKRIRHRFDDSSIQEVYDLYKKLRLSNCGQISLVLVRYFLKISRKTPKEFYTQIFEELTLQLNYDQPVRNKLVILTLLYNMALTHPELEWENHYDQIFTFFSRYYLQRMPLGFTYVQPQQKLYYLSIYNPQSLIQSLLISLISPETEKDKHEKVWKYIHRFFNLIKQYLHPNYENTATIKFLFQQFQQFVSSYIWTHAEQQKQIHNLEKLKAKLERKVKILTAAAKQDEQLVSQQGLPGDEQDDLNDQNIDTELLNEEEGNMQMDKEMNTFKQQAEYEGNDNQQNNHMQQQKIEEEEGEDEDDEDSDDDEEVDDKFKKEFIEKSQTEQTEVIEKIQKKLQSLTEKLTTKKKFAFDKACNEQFEVIIESNLINILGLNDQSGNILTQICKDLCYFNPNKFIPIILDNIYEAFEKPDMNYSTAISVLTAIVIPMVDRTNYRKGIYQIPTLMKKVIDIFNTSNFQLSVKMWKLFDQIFQVVPIYNVDDLQDAYMQKNPTKSYSDFYQDLNKDEDINMITYYEQLHDVTYNVFKKFLSIFEHIDMPRSKNTRGFRAAVMSVLNFFTSLAFSASKRLFKQLWSHAFECITDRQQLHASKFYSYLIHAFTLRDPQLVLSSMIPYLFEHILSKRENADLTEISKQPLYYLIEQQPNKEQILSYQIESINSNSLFWYLNLLEDSIFFGRSEILKYKQEIETIIFLCFVHTETELSKKACQLLQKLFHSLITFYPQEMFIWSENEIESDPNYKELYHRYIGQNSKKKFSMQWHEPTQAEVEYSKDLFFRVYNPILNHFNTVHFKDLQPLDIENNYTSLLDATLRAPDNAPRSLKTELQRSIMILFHLYSSVAIRLKWGIDESDSIYQRFSKTFCLPEYDNINGEMIDFSENMINFLIKNNLFYDSNVAQVYLSLILFILGNDDQTSYINGIKNKLKDMKNFNSNPYRSYQGYPRFVEVTSITTQFNTKVILYTFDAKLNEKHSKLLNPLLFLILHPYQKISEKSINSFLLMADMLHSKSHYIQNLKTFCSFLQAKLNKKSAEFLPKIIEDCKEKDPKLVPLLSTYLERVISSQIILNFVIKRFEPEYGFVIDTLMSIIESYNVFLSKDTKDKIIDIPLNQLLHLVSKLKKLYGAFNEPIQRLGIYKEKSQVITKILEAETTERTHQLEGAEKKQQIEAFLKQIYDRCILNLDDPTVFSKEKSFMIIIAMKTANFCNVNDERFKKILEHAINFTNYDNLHSRNIGRAVLFKCIRTIKAEYKTRIEKVTIDDDYVKDQNKSIEELCSYFLFKQSDVNDGFYSNRHQDFILYKKSSTYKDHKNDLILYKKMTDPQFLKEFLDHILNDITTHSMAEQSLRPKNVFNSPDLIYQQEFIKNFKKKNFFSDGPQFFHLKFLKKVFSLLGMEFFEAAKIQLEKHKNDNATFEAALIMNVLTFSCLLGLFSIELDATEQQKEEAYQYIIEIISDRIYTLNLEQFAYFMKYLEAVIESVSYFDSQKVFDDIFKSPKLSNQQDPKYQRYLYTKLLSLNKFNIKNQEILNGLINELKTVNPQSIQQLPIYNLVHNAIWSYHQIPIDVNFCKKYGIVKDIDQLLESGKLKQIDSFQAVRTNPQIKEIYEFIVTQLNSEDPEVKKKYYRLTKSFSSIFKEDHLFKTEIFNSMRTLFPYLIEFKDEDIVDAQLVQELWSNLIFLSIPLYNKETVIEILQLCYSNFKNTNWRVRQRALLFNQFIAFFNLYRIGDYNYIDPLLDMMNDEQKQNKSIAQKVLSSMIKTLPVEQVGGFVQRMQQMAVSEDKNQKITAIYCLMSVLLSYPHDIKDWTENAIRTILKNKNISPDTLTLLKEFGNTFLRNALHNKIETKLKLPEDLVIRLEEISRPHNYFA